MFELFDTRDNRRVSVAVYYDEQRAWDAIARIRSLVNRGEYRQDLKDSVDFYSVREQDENVLYLTPAEVAQLDNLLDN